MFRADQDYLAASKGTYMFKAKNVYYSPLASDNVLIAQFGNSASHEAILRRALGEDEYNRILGSTNPLLAYSYALRRLAIQEEPEKVLADAMKLKTHLMKVAHGSSLSNWDEYQVLKVLRRMGRLATPLGDWAWQLTALGRLTSIPYDDLEVSSQVLSGPGVYFYKALRVTALLNGPKTFIVSAGASGTQDHGHVVIRTALEVVLPSDRILKVTPGFLRIATDGGGTSGSVEFREKESFAPPVENEKTRY